MNDFSAVGIAWVVMIVLVFGAAVSGHSISENSINSDCKNFGKFSINNKVYECKLVEINSK